MTIGAWRSLVAHTAGGRAVAGSNPVAPTIPILSPGKITFLILFYQGCFPGHCPFFKIIRMSAELSYRPCVGIALFNQDNKVFVAERVDLPGSWQMSKGGIDPGELPGEVAMRELKEEISTDQAEIIDRTEDWLCYDLPANLSRKILKENTADKNNFGMRCDLRAMTLKLICILKNQNLLNGSG